MFKQSNLFVSQSCFFCRASHGLRRSSANTKPEVILCQSVRPLVLKTDTYALTVWQETDKCGEILCAMLLSSVVLIIPSEWQCPRRSTCSGALTPSFFSQVFWCLRADGTVSWRWWILFIPLHGVNGLYHVVLGCLHEEKSSRPVLVKMCVLGGLLYGLVS